MEANIKEEDAIKLKKFGELISKSIKEEYHLDINQLDEIYMSIRDTILKKNEEICEWYDEAYMTDIMNLKNKRIIFQKH